MGWKRVVTKKRFYWTVHPLLGDSYIQENVIIYVSLRLRVAKPKDKMEFPA